MATTLGFVTPLIGSFLLVVKWIVNFQKDITDKYRDELKETRKEFGEYKVSVERRMAHLEGEVTRLSNDYTSERNYSQKLITHMKNEGLELPDELERRKATT